MAQSKERGQDFMYAAVRQYEMGAGFAADLMRILDDHFATELSRQPGFVSYHVIASGSDEIVSVTVFDDEPSAAGSNRFAAEFVRSHLTGFELNLVSQMSGEVRVSRARAGELQVKRG